MAKTKTLGIRLSPALISELERLKQSFAFASYGEMMENLVDLLESIDECVSRIKGHPRDWNSDDAKKCLALENEDAASCRTMLNRLLWRRLKERFGQDGLQHVQELLGQGSLASRRK